MSGQQQICNGQLACPEMRAFHLRLIETSFFVVNVVLIEKQIVISSIILVYANDLKKLFSQSSLSLTLTRLYLIFRLKFKQTQWIEN
jgi:hypothetical protein